METCSPAAGSARRTGRAVGDGAAGPADGGAETSTCARSTVVVREAPTGVLIAAYPVRRRCCAHGTYRSGRPPAVCPFADARAAITGSPTAMPASTASACFTVDAPESLITPERTQRGPGRRQRTGQASGGDDPERSGQHPDRGRQGAEQLAVAAERDLPVRLDPHLPAAQHLDLRTAHVRAVRQLAHDGEEPPLVRVPDDDHVEQAVVD